MIRDNHGNEVLFERHLAKTGVETINSAPDHPETLGKLERFHRTLNRPAVSQMCPERLNCLGNDPSQITPEETFSC